MESRTQWQDGVGMILIHTGSDEEQTTHTNLTVGEGDLLWGLGIAAVIGLVVISLCLITRLNLSLFTRRAKRRLRKPSSRGKRHDSTKGKKSSIEVTNDPEKAASTDIVAQSATDSVARNAKASTLENAPTTHVKNPPKVGAKTKNILNMIDSTLSGELPSTSVYRTVSVESIDEIGYYGGRRSSKVSIALSLVMDDDNTKPIFVYQKPSKPWL